MAPPSIPAHYSCDQLGQSIYSVFCSDTAECQDTTTMPSLATIHLTWIIYKCCSELGGGANPKERKNNNRCLDYVESKSIQSSKHLILRCVQLTKPNPVLGHPLQTIPPYEPPNLDQGHGRSVHAWTRDPCLDIPLHSPFERVAMGTVCTLHLFDVCNKHLHKMCTLHLVSATPALTELQS